jgi:hypothetical protein
LLNPTSLVHLLCGCHCDEPPFASGSPRSPSRQQGSLAARRENCPRVAGAICNLREKLHVHVSVKLKLAQHHSPLFPSVIKEEDAPAASVCSVSSSSSSCGVRHQLSAPPPCPPPSPPPTVHTIDKNEPVSEGYSYTSMFNFVFALWMLHFLSFISTLDVFVQKNSILAFSYD